MSISENGSAPGGDRHVPLAGACLAGLAATTLPAALPRAVTLARATMGNVRQNLLLAFLYNCLAIPVAAGVLHPWIGHVTSPMLAAAAMTVSSLSVIANALRLRRLDLASGDTEPGDPPAA